MEILVMDTNENNVDDGKEVSTGTGINRFAFTLGLHYKDWKRTKHHSIDPNASKI